MVPRHSDPIVVFVLKIFSLFAVSFMCVNGNGFVVPTSFSIFFSFRFFSFHSFSLGLFGLFEFRDVCNNAIDSVLIPFLRNDCYFSSSFLPSFSYFLFQIKFCLELLPNAPFAIIIRNPTSQ